MQTLRTISLALLAAALSGSAPRSAAHAQPALKPGTYRCASYNVSGGGGSCRTMPRLVLNADGTYHLSSTHGQWTAANGKLVLSESKLWGPGTILGPDQVRFEYDYRDWHHVVTWACEDCASGESARSGDRGAASGGGTPIGVSLTLEFGRNVGGVSTFTIVPAESARQYSHNAPLPSGAVQGLARAVTRTSVALATSKKNVLPGGRRYVVFLSWPAETLPVAILDLPAQNDDYTGTLRGTFDGKSVLAKLDK